MELRLPLVTLPVLLMLGELAIVGAFHAPCASLAAAAEETRPADRFPWRTAAPESQGMSSQKLDALRQSLAANATKILLIIRNDKIVYEWYAPGFSATRTHYTASAAKALVGGVSLAVAMTDGRIAMDDKAAKYVPQWRDDPRKSKITIRQLGSHTSGIEDAEQDDIPHDKLPGWKGVFWKPTTPPNDPFTVARDKAAVIFEPGTDQQYSNPGIAMLGYCITAALKDAPQKDLRTLLRDRVMRPIGVPDEEWSVGYNKTFLVDGLPLVGTWGGGGYTARAAARVGRLMLRGGNWEGKQLISADAVRQVTSDAGMPGTCGIGWWSNNEGRYPKLPKDAFWGAGAGHQLVLVVPSLNLIAVRNGGTLKAGSGYESAAYEAFFAPLMDTFVQSAARPAKTAGRAARAIRKSSDSPLPPADLKPPYPPSPVIREVRWAPADTIVRRAKGGDNWPITWADDDWLYTAYGDGKGFEPQIKTKLSLGLCRIQGEPADFIAENLRAPSLERIGDGPKGPKASGILMIEGVLYLLARNTGNAQLVISKDHGRTWSWCDWRFKPSFGCPTFLNFGKNYAGARDEYVYVYSHDNDSAYEPADRTVLARVPKDRLTDRAAYEFFARIDDQGQPVWTRDIAGRGAVFTNSGSCYRTAVTYHPALRRYLLCQKLPGGDVRYEGGFGIYDAPEPWGPWTTVYFTTRWDVGPGESSSIPTRWMSADGKSFYLVFAGNDCFSVRRADLVIAR